MGWLARDIRTIGFFASESGDAAWNYESVLKIYRRIEDCRVHRTYASRTGGLVFVQSAPDRIRLLRMVEGARSIGCDFDSNNGV